MRHATILLSSLATLALAACGSPEEEAALPVENVAMAEPMAMETEQPGSIVEVAQGNSNLSTLVAAVQSANLADTLSGPGPYTVFAPTNAAFEEIPQATRDQLMSEAGREDLANILTYHVVEGEVTAQALTSAIEQAGEQGYTVTTVNGATLTAMIENGNVVLRDQAGNTATVTQTDVDASNGVVHVIDSVLMPS